MKNRLGHLSYLRVCSRLKLYHQYILKFLLFLINEKYVPFISIYPNSYLWSMILFIMLIVINNPFRGVLRSWDTEANKLSLY